VVVSCSAYLVRGRLEEVRRDSSILFEYVYSYLTHLDSLPLLLLHSLTAELGCEERSYLRVDFAMPICLSRSVFSLVA